MMRPPLRWPLPLLAGLLLLATACAGGAQPTTQDAITPLPSPSASVSPSPASPTPIEPRYPNLSRFTDPIDRFSYKSAYTDCRFLELEGAADAYGGNPAEPASVARAYASAIYSQATSYREAAFQGCIDALTEPRGDI
jgi:hypothetical protein